MTPGFLEYYNTELAHIRQMAGEFARAYPKIAARLDLDSSGKETCPDPFVERMLEGFAYLAARTRLKLDSEFPRFTQALLETVLPEYLSPTPSMAVVHFAPDTTNPALADGFKIPRGTQVRTRRGVEEPSSCLYRTAHDVTLWPIRISEVNYLDRNVHSLGLPEGVHPASALQITLKTTGGVPFSDIPLDQLTFYLHGGDSFPSSVMEHLFAHTVDIWVRGLRQTENSWLSLGKEALQPVGIAPEESLLPTGAPTFDGYRLLMEYFAFPQRFLFFSISHLNTANLQGHTLDITFALSQADPLVSRDLHPSHFELYSTPVVNLFHKRTDRVDIDVARSEHHIVVDRTKPLDYEVFSIEKVTGYGESPDDDQSFRPFYQTHDQSNTSEAYFTVNRRQRTPTEREKKYGSLTSYVGSEIYVSLVDADAAPHRPELQQIGVTALCTNRHLPIRLSQGGRSADFLVEVNGPVSAIRCLSGPTPPKPSHAMGETAWRLISHLSVNYLALSDGPNDADGPALRELLKLYLPPDDRSGRRQMDGLKSVTHRPVLRRVPTPGMIVFTRGLEVNLLFDEDAFAGTGIFLLGMVLEQFFARHVSMNSFTETVIKSTQRGEILRWPARNGRRQLV